MHIFRNDNLENPITFDPQFEFAIGERLMDFNGEFIKIDRYFPDSDKIRVHFVIKDQVKALECYKFFYMSREALPGTRTVIFLNKPGKSKECLNTNRGNIREVW
jgi:hypothetical protein